MKTVSTEQLIQKALKARENAYTPYSNWAVGAALLTEDGTVYTGCNIENAAFTPTSCAERTAFFTAVGNGERNDFCRIAIVGGWAGKTPEQFCPPCGVCRQVMMEFCDPETFEIVLATTPENYKVFKLKELLPLGFGPEDLDQK